MSVMGVSGVGGDRFARTLEESLGELYDLVPGEVYRNAAEKLGKMTASPEDVQAVSDNIHLDALLAGSIRGSGRRRQLAIAVRSGASGRVIAKLRYDLGRITLPLLRDRVISDLVRALERASTERTPLAEDRSAKEESTESESAEPGAAAADSEEVALERETEPMSVERGRPKGESATRGMFAAVGLSLLSRSLSFDVPSAPSYSGGTIAGARVDGGVFPFALSAELSQAHPVIASFGLVGRYERAFDYTSSTSNAKSTGRASRWSALLVGRIPLGRGARSAALIVETGFGEMTYAHASTVDIGVPDIGYELFDAGLRLDLPIVRRAIRLDGRLAILGLTGAGEIASATEYGQTNGWGLDLEGGLTVWPTSWLWGRIAADFTRMALSFSGTGTRYARSATDSWLGGVMEIGFAL